MSIMIIYNKKAPVTPSLLSRMIVKILKLFVRNLIIWEPGFGDSHFPVIFCKILEPAFKNSLSGKDKE